MKEHNNGIPVTEYEAQSIDEFLSLLDKRNKIWKGSELSKNLWIYRGQWESMSLGLKPKSLRRNLGLKDKSVKDYIMQEPLPNGSNIEDFSKNILMVYRNKELHLDFQLRIVTKQDANRIKEIIKQSLTEVLLLKKFIVACNNSALYLQDTKIDLRGGRQDHLTSERAILFLHEPLERWLTECLNIESSYSVKSYPPFFEYLNYYPLALAQHSGVPTRLLDWTRSPLIAAFFAAGERINNKNKAKGKICVYAFDIQYQDDYISYPNSLRIHRDLTHNEFEFLHAQKGILTEMRGADFYYFKHGKWPSLYEHIAYFDRAVEVGQPLYNLKKISLAGEFAEELLKQLEIEDITKATLMPTYFHCAEYVLKK